MSKQDRQRARTPADLEYRYAFGKSFAEIMGIATDARNTAEEAKKVSASVKETNNGIEARVKSLEDNASGEVALEIVEAADGTKYSQLRSDVDKMVFKSGEVSIASDDFTLNADGSAKFSGELQAATGTFSGELNAAKGTFQGELQAATGTLAGWTIDEYGIHQTHGLYGEYTITYSSTGTSIDAETHEGYLFYCLEAGGIYCYILQNDEFRLYGELVGEVIPVWKWKGDMFGNHKITRTVVTETPT